MTVFYTLLGNPLLLAAYVLLSVTVGLFGLRRRIGFVGFFILSLLFTPFLMALVLVVTRPKHAYLD